MSNPFRRKLSSDGAPNTSTRPSFDLDEARIQHAAEQAFSPMVDSFDKNEIKEEPENDSIKAVKNVNGNDEQEVETNTNIDSLTERETLQVRIGEENVEIVPDVPVKTNEYEDKVEQKTITASTPPPAPKSRPLSVQPRASVPPAPPPPRGILRKTTRPVPLDSSTMSTAGYPSEVEVIPPTPTDPFSEVAASEEVDVKNYSVEESDEESILNEDEIRVEKTRKSPGTMEVSNDIDKVPGKSPSPGHDIVLPMNPFRRKDDVENNPGRRRSLETDAPKFTGNVQPNSDRRAARHTLDVDAFKRLMLTGQGFSASDGPSTDTSNQSRQSLLDATSDKNASWTPRTSQDTPRTSHEISAGEEDGSLERHNSIQSKSKPLPPRPRRQASTRVNEAASADVSPSQSKRPSIDAAMSDTPPRPPSRKNSASSATISPARRRSSFQSSDLETSEEPDSYSEPRTTTPLPRKIPPTPPVTRRVSTRVPSSSSMDHHTSISDSPSPSITQPHSQTQSPIPPPPPPTRRGGAGIATPTTQGTDTPVKPSSLANALRAVDASGPHQHSPSSSPPLPPPPPLSTPAISGAGGTNDVTTIQTTTTPKKFVPSVPPARRGSKRISSQPSPRLSATTSSTSPLSTASTGPPIPTGSIPALTPPLRPPPPPSRRRSQLVSSAVVVPEADDEDGERESGRENERLREADININILDDLTKLQREVDELRGRVKV